MEAQGNRKKQTKNLVWSTKLRVTEKPRQEMLKKVAGKAQEFGQGQIKDGQFQQHRV